MINDGWMDGWMNIDGWMVMGNGWMDGWIVMDN